MFIHIVSCCSLLLCPVMTLPHDEKSTDHNRLQGMWVAVHVWKYDGISHSIRSAMKYLLSMEKDLFVFELADPAVKNDVLKGRFQIDPAKSPKTMDITLKGRDGNPIKLLAIYEFKDDALEFCMGLEGKDRPKDFKSPKEGEAWRFTLKKGLKPARIR